MQTMVKATRTLTSEFFLNSDSHQKLKISEVSNRKEVLVKSKCSQFKIQQMSFMLLAVVLFFILVALFWLTLQSKNLHKTATQLEEDKAVAVSIFLADSSEFNCASESYCIDTDKIIALMDKSNYNGFWPVSYIKIRRVGNETKDKICNKANYPDCNIYDVYNNNNVNYNGTGISSFVALCRYEKVDEYTNRICDLGKIIIGYDIK